MIEPTPRARRAMAMAVAWLAAVLAAGCQRDGDVAARGPTTPGGGGQQLHSASGPTAMTITPDVLRTWSEQLCIQPALDFAGALRALGISGSLVEKTSDYSIVEPPLPGTSRVALSLENLGKNKGFLSTIELTLAGAKLTRAELDQRFGASNAPPRVDYDRPHVLIYQVTVPGAPYRCSVQASFTDEPGEASGATAVRLRRDVVKPPPGQAQP